ncbi:hypothetical protein Pan241w_08260 [Gimesia alba]|uniref:Uncharacterized protein n=1 Tax=Gimesia alba TaxID=2527973 RepID=A0A517RA48_9PLAN|nr:hypothetical protein Pan241w_08260 [Gimesia alba]
MGQADFPGNVGSRSCGGVDEVNLLAFYFVVTKI